MGFLCQPYLNGDAGQGENLKRTSVVSYRRYSQDVREPELKVFSGGVDWKQAAMFGIKRLTAAIQKVN